MNRTPKCQAVKLACFSLFCRTTHITISSAITGLADDAILEAVEAIRVSHDEKSKATFSALIAKS